MLKIKPEFWTKDGGKKFVVMSLQDFEKVQELIEDAGLARILKRAKQHDTGEPGISLAQMKKRLGLSAGAVRRAAGVKA